MPRIDPRNTAQIVRDLEEHAEAYTSTLDHPWRRSRAESLDPGGALIRIAARMAEQVIYRLNRAPEKNFLAFLDLIGTQILPAQPARAPLTFRLATGGTTDILVPAGTQAASTPEDGGDDIIFETDEDLVVTPAVMRAVMVHQPDSDRWADRTRWATGGDAGEGVTGFPVFEGDRPIEHSFYLAHDDCFLMTEPKTLRLRFRSSHAVALAALPITWSYWDGASWRELPRSPGITEGLAVSISADRPEVVVEPGAAIDSEGHEITLSADRTVDLSPFKGQTILLLISWSDQDPSGRPTIDPIPEERAGEFPTRDRLRLARLEIDANGLVRKAVRSRVETPSPSELPLWTVSIEDPPAPTPSPVDGAEAGWIRATLDVPLPPSHETSGGSAADRIKRSGLPLESLAAGEHRLDPNAPFHPFGAAEQPVEFWLKFDEAFARPGATVTLDPEFADSGRGAASSDLVLSWTYWNGSDQQQLGWSGSTALLSERRNLNRRHGFGETTRGLSRNGRVRLRVPDDWRDSNQAGARGRWLRVEVVEGNYGFGESHVAPELVGLRASYEWALPRIEQVEAEVSLTREDVAPDLAFFNSLKIDLGKDFYPFGEKPRFNDTFYLGSEEVFSKPGATVKLEVKLTESRTVAGSAEIGWETWTGRRWQKIEAAEGGGGSNSENSAAQFRESGIIDFSLPETVGPGTVAGETGHWVRARILNGDFGKDSAVVEEKEADGSTKRDRDGRIIYKVVPASFAPPAIASLSIGYTHAQKRPPASCKTFNDFAFVDCTVPAVGGGEVADDGVARASRGFHPFTPTRERDPGLYCGFDRSFSQRPVTLYAGVEPLLYEKADEEVEGLGHDVRNGAPPGVVWEYAEASGWSPLGARDETGGFSQRGLVSFIGPVSSARSLFGRDLVWLRARQEGAVPVPPTLRSLLPNTTWASQVVTVTNEVLGSSTGDTGQRYLTTQTPVLGDPRVEVRELDGATEDEVAAIRAETEEGDVTVGRDAAGEVEEVWVRWREVTDFHGSGPRDRHFVLDHMKGEIRFGGGLQGRAPPSGTGNIRLARYRAGGGIAGNRPAASVATLKSAVAYIDGVSNPEAAAGGSEAETLEQVRERGPTLLRHSGRAVTYQDFEDLAREASPEVARSRAVAAASGEPGGRVGLIVVPRADGPQPVPSLELIRRVEAYVRERAVPTLDLWVAGPDWVRATVSVQVVPRASAGGKDIESEVRAALEEFLHPLTGGFDGRGRPFGRRPHASDLYALLESLPGVDHVRTLSVAEEEIGTVRDERFLVFSGSHSIRLISPMTGA